MDYAHTLIDVVKLLPIILYSIITGIIQWLIPRFLIAKDVSKDTVLITGAGSGLGRDIALEYARLGSSLVLWDINSQGLEETKVMVEEEFQNYSQKSTENLINEKRKCLTYVVDVSDRSQIKGFADQVFLDLNNDRASDEKERYVSVLVNNAGIYYGLLLQQLTDEQIERIFKINILAHFWTVRAFLPKMIEHEKGHIVEISSMGGINGMLKQVDYCATKFATVGFEESLSLELDHLGLADKIKTTVVCPLFFSSNLFTGFDSSAAPLMTSDFVAKEAVLTMRCNHARILLPKLSAYMIYITRTFMTRRAMILGTSAVGFDRSIREIKGKAASS